MKKSFREFLKERKLILHCGATGTELMKIGGETPGAVNTITRPQDVLRIQRDYVEAGAKIVLTNTFAMNPLYSDVRCKGYDWALLNRRGVELAEEAAGGEAYVFGNVGPVGEMLEPLGTLKKTDAYEAYGAQIKILADGGADGISIQTFFDLEDMILAVKAVRDYCDLPIIANLVFNQNGATMMGNTPQQCYDALYPMGIDVFGHNCGEIDAFSLGDLFSDLAKKTEIPLVALPNAGIPKTVEGKPVYEMTNEEFRRGTEYLIEKGFTVLGGCCGVNVGHIRAIADLFVQE